MPQSHPALQPPRRALHAFSLPGEITVSLIMRSYDKVLGNRVVNGTPHRRAATNNGGSAPGMPGTDGALPGLELEGSGIVPVNVFVPALNPGSTKDPPAHIQRLLQESLSCSHSFAPFVSYLRKMREPGGPLSAGASAATPPPSRVRTSPLSGGRGSAAASASPL